ncbi:MAG: hypothetical protein A2Y10_06015 [Planctomycetes bacterium GWF2_41_51]|nr:MAG: hypothetical protein A2Y10_06015 [Planctomycetes bacterium GWF2_41_51]
MTERNAAEISTTKKYALKIGSVATLIFLATILIPYCYDQSNLRDFIQAEKKGGLIVREFSSQIFSLHLEETNGKLVDSNSPRDFLRTSEEFLKDKLLVSNDYISQMNKVRELVTLKLVMFIAVLSILLFLGITLVVNFIKKFYIRTPLIGFIFVGTLLSLKLFGLPHTNYKFHLIFGIIYGSLLSLSDFLLTLDLHLSNDRAEPDDKNWGGYLSSLQYKHRFWTSVFNMSVASVLTALCTLSFITFDVFQRVFGEGFSTNPLVGLLIAVIISLAMIFVGVFYPIQKHIANIEKSMIGKP